MLNRVLSIGAAVLAVTALLLAWMRPEAPPPAEAARVVAEDPPELDEDQLYDLFDRLAALEERYEFLARRVTALERRPSGTGGGAVAAGDSPQSLAAEVAQLRQEVRGLVAGEVLHSDTGRGYLKDMVKEAQEEIREEQRRQSFERFARAQEAAQAQQQERLRRFITEAKLTYAQEQAVTQRLTDEAQRRAALFDAVRAGTKSPQEARREVRQLRRETDEAVMAQLDEAQRAQYEAMRREERRGGGGGGRQRGAMGLQNRSR